MVQYAAPNTEGSVVSYEARYDHYIGGAYVPPASGQYFENPTPVTGKTFCEIARGNAEDVEKALDAAHGAAPAWGRTSPEERANVLLKIADRMEQNLEAIAVAEAWENGKAVRETLAADVVVVARFVADDAAFGVRCGVLDHLPCLVARSDG